MMKYTCSLLFSSILLIFTITGCSTGASGPQTWIDFPLDNAVLPLKTLSITAHATDLNGVAKIEFYVDGILYSEVTVGGERLEDATVEWTPPRMGRFALEARGVNSSGSAGTQAMAIINIQAEIPPTTVVPTTPLIISPSPTKVTITPTHTTTKQTPSITPVTPQPPMQPYVTADQNANCRAGPSTTFEVRAYLMQGAQALLEGRLADNSWFVITPPGESQSCWIAASVVNVSGELGGIAIVAAPPPPVPVITIPPIDTTPPSITSNYFSPSEIYLDYPCPGYPTKGVSTVQVSDDGGIASVTAQWTIRNPGGFVVDNGTLTYTRVDGQTFQATFGPTSFSGTLSIEGLVVDTSGNSTTFIQTVIINYCP